MEFKELICPICGSNNFIEINNRFKCKACDNEFIKQEDYSVDEIKMISSINEAESFIRMTPPRFDIAEEKYKLIVKDYPNEAKAYWGLFRAKNNIKYFDGKPICFDYSNKDKIEDDKYLIKAIELSDDELKNRYKQEFTLINANIEGWIKRDQELDYDVFISFKNEENGERTEDYHFAQNLYTYLIDKGLKVFFSPVTMKKHLGEAIFDAYIFNALSKSKVLIVYGSKNEYFESDWIECEWSRYINLINSKNKDDDSLLICYQNINPNELHRSLRARQLCDASSLNIFEDIFNKIFVILSRSFNNSNYSRNKINRIKDPKIELYKRQEIIKKIHKKEFNTKIIIDNKELKNNLPKIQTKSIGNIFIHKDKSNAENIEIKLNKIKQLIERHEFSFAEKYIIEVEELEPNNPETILYRLLNKHFSGTIEELLEKKINDLTNDDFEKISTIIEYSKEENASLILSKLSNYVLDKLYNAEYDNSLKIYKTIIYYDEKIIENLRVNVIKECMKLSSIKSYNLQFTDFIDLSLEYISKNKKEYKKQLRFIIDSLFNIEATNYYHPSISHFFNLYSNVAEYDYEYYVYKLKISNQTINLYDAISNLSFNGRINELAEILDSTDEESANKLIEDIIKIIIRMFENGKYNDIYLILEVVLPYDFYNKTNIILDLLDLCIRNASSYNNDIFDLLMSALNSNDNFNRIQHYADSNEELIVKEDSDWYAIKRFANFNNVKKIIIHENCKSIDKKIFESFINLNEIEIYNENIELNNVDFNSYIFNKLTIPLNLISKFNSDSIKNLKIVKTKIIPENCFLNNLNINTISFDDKLEIIQKNAFENCENLEKVIFPKSLIEIQDNAFKKCAKLKNLDLPNSISIFSNTSFSGCYFDNLTFPVELFGKIEKIRATSVKITGEGGIEEKTSFTSLQNLELSNKINKISHTWDIRNIYYDGDIEDWCKIKFDNGLSNLMTHFFDRTTNFYLLDHNGDIEFNGNKYSLLTDLEIPNHIESIGQHQFSCFEQLKNITIPSSVKSIGIGAFDGCSKLESITLPFVGENSTTNTYLGYIFGAKDSYNHSSYVPSSLKMVNILDGCTSIGKDAFYNCSSLTNIKIPSSMKYIGKTPFMGCTSLRTIYYDGTIEDWCNMEFVNPAVLKKIYIIDDIGYDIGYEIYKDKKYSSLTKISEIPNTIKKIGEYQFYSFTNITKFTIPSGVTSIGKSAFANCSSLTSITIPSSIKRIDATPFMGCTSLKTIYYDGTKEDWNIIKKIEGWNTIIYSSKKKNGVNVTDIIKFTK